MTHFTYNHLLPSIHNIQAYGISIFMVDVQKFWTLVASPKCPDKQCRPRSDSLVRVFLVCYSDKHLVKFSLYSQHFIWEQKEKSVWNFRTFTINALLPVIYGPTTDNSVVKVQQMRQGRNQRELFEFFLPKSTVVQSCQDVSWVEPVHVLNRG